MPMSSCLGSQADSHVLGGVDSASAIGKLTNQLFNSDKQDLIKGALGTYQASGKKKDQRYRDDVPHTSKPTLSPNLPVS